MATDLATPHAPKVAAPAPEAEVSVHEPAANNVGNDFVNSLRAEFDRQQSVPHVPHGTNGADKPKEELKQEVKTEVKTDAPKEQVKDAPKEEAKTEGPDPLTELTTLKEEVVTAPKDQPVDDTPENVPSDQKAAGTAWAKLRKEKKEARDLANTLRETLTAKEKQIAELQTKATGDLAKENTTLKERLAEMSRTLAESDITKSPEYVETVTRPTEIIEGYFKQAAENAGSEFTAIMDAVKLEDPFKRNKKLQELLSELTPTDHVTASQAAIEYQKVLATKAEYHTNAEAYQGELKTRRETEAQKAAEGYKTALTASQERLIPALQKSIPVLGDDNIFRTVKESVAAALSKNLTPDQITGGMVALHAMPAMRDKLKTVEKELAEALATIKARNGSEPSTVPGTRETQGEEVTDFVEGLRSEARKQGVRV